MQVNWPKWNKIINEHFVDLTKCYDRYVILYGSRGSSKSDYVSKQLIFNCLTHKYFKCILYRKVHDTIQESSYETIKQNIIALGLESLFQFRVSPLSITCMNGNKFIARGGDNALSLKSIKDPTCVWYEEEAPNEEDFATITLTVRSGKADRLQEFFTINPQVEGDFEDHWFWKRFFKDKDNLSYRATTSVKMEDLNGVKSNVTFDVAVHHSTYKHNRWLPIQAKALIESYKETNTYLYSVYALGLWTHKETGGNAYKNFKRAVSVRDLKLTEGFNDIHRAYNKDLPLHVSFDFNVNPYMTCTVWQLSGKTAYQINELCLPYPRNTSLAVCSEFTSQYKSHTAGLIIYGDPQGLRNYTAVQTIVKSKETDYNEFSIIQNALNVFRPQMRVARNYPPVKLRLDFMNAIFGHNEGGIEIVIDNTCSKSINDFMYLKEASDGTKHKEKVKDTQTGITYEKYGHCFVGSTLISTKEGQKRIDEIVIGDIVYTRNGLKKVTNTFNNGTKQVISYLIGSNRIQCTKDHLVYEKTKGFWPIGHLIGKNIFSIFDENTKSWKYSKLTLFKEMRGEMHVVYDIEVESCHEYFANGILVHNCSDASEYALCEAFKQELQVYQKGDTMPEFTFGARQHSKTKHW